MSLKSGPAAIDCLRGVLGPPPGQPAGGAAGGLDDPARFGPDDLPPGLSFGVIPDWLWDPGSVPFVPLRNQAAYLVPGSAGAPADAVLLSRAPYGVIYDESLSKDDKLPAAQRLAYCRASVDVTMRGGTTSGVVYPLAICEIARWYRLRNVGGASAGAIAAAAAAAAETGRVAESEGIAAPPDPGEDERKQGHVRRGFAGLADTMAWLAEVDDGGREYRVAQLFRPANKARPLFRLFASAMRDTRRWAIPVLLAGAFGWLSKIVNTVAFLFACYLLEARRDSRGLWSFPRLQEWLPGVGVAALGLLAVGVAILGLGWLMILLLSMGSSKQPPELAEPVRANVGPGLMAWRPVPLLVLMLAAPWAVVRFLGLPVWPLVLTFLVLTLVLFLVLVGSAVWLLVWRAKRNGFGMVPGAVDPRERRNLADRIAGMPKGTVQRALVPWLSGTLGELAGLPDTEVLRFGHLWLGLDFDSAQQRKEAVAAAGDPRRRRVNLELMSSELVQRRAYRFPLPYVPDPGPALEGQAWPPERLFVRRSDLERPDRRMFPKNVVAALTERPAVTAHDVVTGEEIDDLHPLPDPWDLPVVFAVRLSLSLPALFEAVRLYRGVFPATVRDELGRPIKRDGTGLKYPPENQAWVDELWFTDGGVTSNFPIHFFDSPLPLWPTFGINLSPHPPGFAHQDVWLPQDSGGTAGAASPLTGGLPSFLGAIVDTARAWRDNTQTAMPTYRGRVAWVRQRPDEGGTNLFMEREKIAALALRGVLAGARLRRRFHDDAWWHRHQWLRLRTTLGNLEGLRSDFKGSFVEPWYGLAMAPGALDTLAGAGFRADPNPPGDWFRPGDVPAFTASASAWAAAVGGLTCAPQMRKGIPQPAPELRQVPPL